MNSTFNNYTGPGTPTPNPRGRPPGKRGRKPRIATDVGSITGPNTAGTSQLTPVQWAQPPTTVGRAESQSHEANTVDLQSVVGSAASFLNLPGVTIPVVGSGGNTTAPGTASRAVREEEEEPGEDEILPAMADDDYSAQLSWQSQSKDNLKYVSWLCVLNL